MPPKIDISPFQFAGLENKPGQRFLNPSYRLKFDAYPLELQQQPMAPVRDTQRMITFDYFPESDGGLMHFQWNKQLGQAAGQWQAAFKELPGRFDFDQLVDGDWVDIGILRNGVYLPLCRGVLDTIREQKQSASGATVVQWNLTGRDHGALFEYPITWSSIWVQTLTELSEGLMTGAVKGAIGGRPDQLFRLLITATFSSEKAPGQWQLPPTLRDALGNNPRFMDMLKIYPLAASKKSIATGLRGAYYNEVQLWHTAEQNLHQALMSWCNPLLNELYYDLLPPQKMQVSNGISDYLIKWGPPNFDLISGNSTFGQASAFIRERPFINSVEKEQSLWFDLPTWIIPAWLVQVCDTGRGGHERINLFELLTDIGFGSTQEQPPQAQPLWHQGDIREHGLRTLQQSTQYLAQFETGPADWFAERKTWLRLLVDWYACSPYLRQGTIVLKVLLPEIRIGHRIILDEGGKPEDNWQFYVEGVSTEFSFPPGQGAMTLTVTHGFRGGDSEYLKKVIATSNYYREVWA
jgi:hypothetical protein